MILTDTHTHLYSEAFDDDQDEMMQRAMDHKVHRFFVPAIDSTYTDRMLDLKRRYPEHVFLMMGLHPTHVNEKVSEELEHVKEMLATDQFVAVGEIGVDLYWSDEFKKEQLDAFHKQIQWSLDRKMPIAIHCRDAFNEVFEVLEDYKNTDLHGIFHCFTGTLEQAQQAIDLNLHLGIGGVATFKNGKIDQFLNQIDLNHIVLETDAPYLSPVPYRGKRNESAYVELVATRLASIYNTTIEEIAQVTTLNSTKIFGL